MNYSYQNDGNVKLGVTTFEIIGLSPVQTGWKLCSQISLPAYEALNETLYDLCVI